MKILFLHGWQSTPGGLKPTFLKDHGHEVLNPALLDDDFDAALKIAQTEYDQQRGHRRCPGTPPTFRNRDRTLLHALMSFYETGIAL